VFVKYTQHANEYPFVFVIDDKANLELLLALLYIAAVPNLYCVDVMTQLPPESAPVPVVPEFVLLPSNLNQKW
jgi:hypothetical protein